MKNNIYINFISNAGAFGTTVLLQFLTIPILLRYWGLDYLSEWLLINAFISYISIADLGVITYNINLICKLNSKNKNDVFHITTLFVFINIIIFSFFIIILIFISLFDINSVLKFRQIKEINLLIVLLSLFYLLNIYQGFIEGVFRAKSLQFIGVNLQSSMRIIDFVILIYSVFIGKFAVDAVLFMLIIRIIYIYFLVIPFMIRILKIKFYLINFFKYKLIHRSFKNSLQYFILPLANYLNNQGQLILIGTQTDKINIVAFNIIKIMARVISGISSIINSTIMNELSSGFYNKNSDIIHIIQKKSLLIIGIVSITIAIMLYLLKKEINSYWGLNIDINVILIGIFLYTIQAMWNNLSTLAYSVNEYLSISNIYFITSMLILLISFQINNIQLIDIMMISILLELVLFYFVYIKNKFIIAKIS